MQSYSVYFNRYALLFCTFAYIKLITKKNKIMTLYSNFEEKHGDFIESILECKARLHIASEGLNSLSEETNKNLSIQTTIKKQSPSCVVTECYVEVIIMCDNSIFHRINEIMGQQGFELDEDYSGKMKFIYEL